MLVYISTVQALMLHAWAADRFRGGSGLMDLVQVRVEGTGPLALFTGSQDSFP